MGRTRAATPAGRERSSQAKPAAKPAGTAAKGPKAKAKTKPKSTAKPRTAAKANAKPKAAAKRRPSGAAKRVRDPKKRRSPSGSGASARPKLLASLRGGGRSRKRSARRVSWRYRLGMVAIALVAGGAGYMLWLRDSSLVAIDNVDVVGVTSGDREQIVAELTRVGEGMTTLNVDRERLESAAAAFPTVDSVHLDPNFPHGLRIEVDERPPALLVSAAGREVPVAADGTLLNGVEVPEDESLPVVEVNEIPPQGSLEGEPLEQALVAGATPEPLRPLVETVDHSDDTGVSVELRGGIPVRFGSGSRATEKWAAAAAVLADPKLDAVTYVDVRVPERPAAGGAAIAGSVSIDPPA